MSWDYVTGTGSIDGGFDLGAIMGRQGEDTSPLADNSYGGQDMQASTPGTGGGEYFSFDSIMGGLKTAVNYAILRDQQKLARSPENLVYARQSMAVEQQQVQAKDSRLLLWLALGGGVLWLATRN